MSSDLDETKSTGVLNGGLPKLAVRVTCWDNVFLTLFGAGWGTTRPDPGVPSVF